MTIEKNKDQNNSLLIYSEEKLDKPFQLDINNLQNYQNVILSNKIIRANQKLSVTEKRIISYCISQIKQNERHAKNLLYIQEFLERRKFSISAEVFSDLYDYKNKNNAYRDLKAAAKSLFERSAQIKFEEQSEDYVRFVDRVKYNNGNGIVDLYFTPDIYLHLFEFEGNYTQYNLKIGTSFKSMYAHRIFELLQSRKDTNCIILSNKELRFILDIPESYKTYAKLKEKVFEPTAKEFKKFGMEVEIKISKDPNDKLNDIISITTNKNVNDIVKELGLTEENKLKLLQSNNEKIDLNIKNEEEVKFLKLKQLTEEDYEELVSIFTIFSKEDFIKMDKEKLLFYVEQLEEWRKNNNFNQKPLLRKKEEDIFQSKFFTL